MDLASLKHNLVNSIKILGLPGDIVVKNLPANAGDTRGVWSLGWENSLEVEMATHSHILA